MEVEQGHKNKAGQLKLISENSKIKSEMIM